MLWVAALAQEYFAEPFEELNGPIAAEEVWEYEVEEKFGRMEKVLISRIRTIYDTYLNPLETIWYTKDGAIEKRYVRTFDVEGRLVRVAKYNGSNQLIEVTTFEYEGLVGFPGLTMLREG